MRRKALQVCASMGAFVATSDAFDGANRRLRGNNSSAYDCDGGCPMDKANAVCAGGVTFKNECFALCQGMESIAEGPCNDGPDMDFLLKDSMSLMPELLSDTTPTVSPDAMNRYAEENYLFVGDVAMSFGERPEKFGPVLDPLLDENGNPQPVSQQEFGDTVTAIRVTFDGLAYISTYVAGDDGENQQSSDKKTGKGQSREPTTDSDDKRPKKAKGNSEKWDSSTTEDSKLLDVDNENVFHDTGAMNLEINLESIIGDDTREPVRNTMVDPYKKIVELDYGSGEGGCSGTVVGPNSIMTAAHCVYNRGGRSWFPVRAVAPGRYRERDDTIEPFGTWEALDATIYAAWANGGVVSHDIAILRVRPNRSGSIGDVMGTIPLKWYNCEVPSDSTITGYPADKPNGEMNTSGPCEGWRHDCGNMRVYHKCDTKGGNSGSSMLDGDGAAFGVHTHGGSSWNSGVSLTSNHLRNLRRWTR